MSFSFVCTLYIEWNQYESTECLLCEILTLIRRFNSEQYTRTEIQDKERENTTWKKASNLSTQFGVCVCVWSEKKYHNFISSNHNCHQVYQVCAVRLSLVEAFALDFRFSYSFFYSFFALSGCAREHFGY